MKDRERGVVWEETIIFLEDETKMVRLSPIGFMCLQSALYFSGDEIQGGDPQGGGAYDVSSFASGLPLCHSVQCL